MKSILVPTDFSKCAANALQHAMNLARNTGAEVTVVHVVFPNEGVDNNIYNVYWTDDYMAERTKGLMTWTHRLQKTAGFKDVKLNTKCMIGFPVPAICETADKIGADLIVMGTTGATGLKGAFLGSIAAGVMSQTKRPLLSVPKKSVPDKAKNIAFATDFRFKIDEHSLQVLTAFIKFKKGTLHFVHIIEKLGIEPDKTREKTISQKFPGIPHDFHYLHDRDITQAVSNFIEATEASTLVAIAHEHSLMHRLFFDSMTRRLAHRIHIPMLTLHDSTNT